MTLYFPSYKIKMVLCGLEPTWGVVRYDGHSFNLIQPDPQKSNSLSYKHVNNLYVIHMEIYGSDLPKMP